MTEPKFTQGQWKRLGLNVTCDTHLIAHCHIWPPGNINHDLEPEEAEANAKLIAAAPLGYDLAEIILNLAWDKKYMALRYNKAFKELVKRAKRFMEKLK